MALERADRLPLVQGAVFIAQSENSREFFASKDLPRLPLDKVSPLAYSPSQGSLDTRASRGNCSCEKEDRDEVDASPYVIRNLTTGEVVDLRDECTDAFPEAFAKVTDSEPKITKVRELYRIRRAMAVSLYSACQVNNLVRVTELLERGANPSARLSCSWTALHTAADRGLAAMCELLLRFHADVSAKTIDSRTPLHLAVMSGHVDVTAALLKSSKTSTLVDEQDCEGMTALHYASKRGDEKLVPLLLSAGANPCIGNNEGDTSLSFCVEGSVYELLRDTVERCRSTASLVTPCRTASEPALPRSPAEVSSERSESPTLGSLELSDFHAIGQLGKGEFGEVFLVEHKLTGQKYAMKSVAKGRNLKDYLKTERNVLARLNHPFIVRLHWAFQSVSHLYLVVDYCPCGDMNELLQRLGPLSEDVARFYISEVVLAIEALHRENVIYRDLKPENIVLGEDGHVCLTDFGLAKTDMPASAITRSFCGPLGYFPPEMVRQQSHGQEVDWYMLGCLAYEILTGEPPFQSHEQTKLFRKIESGRLKYPQWLSAEAKDLIQRLLHLDIEQRLGKNGSSEVKAHPFFENVDWEKVYSKAQPPPLVLPRKKPVSLMGRKVYAISKEDKIETHVSGWTFSRDT